MKAAMRIGDAIYNLDGLPFRSPQPAARMRDLLTGETGMAYAIETHPEGGFILRRESELPGIRRSSSSGHADLPAESSRTTGESAEVDLEGIPMQVFRPAVFRANAAWLPVIAIGALLLFVPQALLGWSLGILDVSPSTLGAWLGRTLNGLKLMGGFLSGALLFWLWTEWASAAYMVSETGVEAREGLVARDTVGLRFQDIRSITLKQSLFERLVNIGILELTSAGTDGRPVRFFDIARPGRVKALIQGRMNRLEGDD